jgi:hypothetical protein
VCRYGDPINPDGDIEAMVDMHRALAPGGYLLLAIPTYASYQVQGIQHRIYGPERLAQMIENFDFTYGARLGRSCLWRMG